MIIYRKEPYPLQMRNIMLLDDNSTGGVVYVSKATYDQALLLHGRFDGNPQRVLDTIKGKGTEVYVFNNPLKELVEKACKEFPEPLNMVAPFLIYATSNQNIDWTKADMVTAYGIVHQLSQLIDFNATTLVPKEIRMQLSLPTAILMQYETSWNELCSTLEERLALVNVASTTVVEKKEESTKKAEPTVSIPKAEPMKEPEEEEEDDGIDWDALNAKLNAIKEAPADNGKVPEPTVSSVSIPKPAPAVSIPTATPAVSIPTPTSSSDAKQASEVLDEFDV